MDTRKITKCTDCNLVVSSLTELIEHERNNGHGTWGQGWWDFQAAHQGAK